MTEVLDNAARVIQERLDQIDEELARYNDLRGERKELEAALRRLTPKAARTTEGSAADAVLAVVTGSDLSIADIHRAVVDYGVPATVAAVSTACAKLTKDGTLTRMSRGIYRAA